MKKLIAGVLLLASTAIAGDFEENKKICTNIHQGDFFQCLDGCDLNFGKGSNSHGICVKKCRWEFSNTVAKCQREMQ